MNWRLVLLCVVAAMVVVIVARRGLFGKPGTARIVPVQSTVDGRTYYVQDKADMQSAADTLAQVRDKMVRLVACVRDNVARGVSFPGVPDDTKEYGSYQSRAEVRCQGSSLLNPPPRPP